MTRWSSLGGHPIEQHDSPNIGGAMTSHRGVVMHHAEGTYRGTISWQMNPDQRYSDGTSVTTSSTWIIGKNAGEIAQMVDTTAIAWCQRGGSRDWLSIEYAGYHTEALTPWQIEATALILARLHTDYGVPIQIAPDPSGRGLGHHSMDREWLGEEWGHDDCPGPKTVAQKGAIVARALEILNGDDMLKDETITLPQYEGNTQATANAATAVAYNLVRGAATLAAVKRIEAAIGKLMTGGVDVDQLADKIAAKVIAADNPLGPADEPAIVAAVKQALAEGVV